MRVAVLTREFPPDVYGGAGVHVDFLVRELRRLIDVDVHCFGAAREGATAHEPDPRLAGANAALQTLSVDLVMASALDGAQVVHSHTWYANLAGHVAKLLYDIPHVVTAHSLEPRRPWKAEQLGGGYALSSWTERTAYEAADAVVAVSPGMRTDILDCYPGVDPDRVHVIGNGIDTDLYRADEGTDVLERLGVDPEQPYVLFVGRITRQKGVGHLLAAAAHLRPGVQVVLCAGAPDTEALGSETARAVSELQVSRPGVMWIREMLPRPDLVQLLTHAAVFLCPSVYEPLGIVNLEAMACGTAVVASAVGGIPEVVADGETGLLVDYDVGRPEQFQHDLAERTNELLDDPGRARQMGAAGRRRAVEEFGWDKIAETTRRLYQSLLESLLQGSG